VFPRSLVRVGTLVAVLGGALAALWAVAFGAVAGCTDVGCQGPPVYAVARVALLPPVLSVSNGCAVCTVAAPVVSGSLAALAGVVLAGAGQVRRARA
jgi:hypothetical protein